METLLSFVRLEAWFLTIAFSVVVGFQLLTGKITTRGLLAAKGQDRGFSPARVQMLLVTLAGAFSYLLQMSGSTTQLPDPPKEMIMALGGSNLLYAASKARALLRHKGKHKNEKGGT